MQIKEKDKRVIGITKNELKVIDESKGERVYKGVGKMCVHAQLLTEYIVTLTEVVSSMFRFVLETLKSTVAGLNSKEKDLSDDVSSLQKKLKVHIAHS